MIQVNRDITHLKSKLMAEALRVGIYENFGQKEVRLLRDKYSEHTYKNDGVWDAIDKFDEWAMTFDDRKLELVKRELPRNLLHTVKAHTRKTKTGKVAVKGHIRRG